MTLFSLLAIVASLHSTDSVRISIPWPELLPEDAMPQENSFTVALTGDIKMGTTFPEERLPADDGEHLFRDCRKLLADADIAAGNLEGVLCDGGESTKKVVEGRSYAFRMPSRYVRWLSEAGYDFMSLANNHARDFGEDGLESTMSLLDSAGIQYAGLPSCRFAVKDVRGTRFGFCAFGHNFYTLEHTDTACVRKIVTELRDTCDILIVSFHGGAEGASMSHLPCGPETYLGEDRGNLRELAHLCVDLGADIVFGHGPHVTRAVELYKDRLIAYSLGNFCTPFGVNVSGVNGYAPLLEAVISRDGRFRTGKIHSFIQTSGIGPRTDPYNTAARHIGTLSITDIPGSPLEVLPDGSLFIAADCNGNP